MKALFWVLSIQVTLSILMSWKLMKQADFAEAFYFLGLSGLSIGILLLVSIHALIEAVDQAAGRVVQGE